MQCQIATLQEAADEGRAPIVVTLLRPEGLLVVQCAQHADLFGAAAQLMVDNPWRPPAFLAWLNALGNTDASVLILTEERAWGVSTGEGEIWLLTKDDTQVMQSVDQAVDAEVMWWVTSSSLTRHVPEGRLHWTDTTRSIAQMLSGWVDGARMPDGALRQGTASALIRTQPRPSTAAPSDTPVRPTRVLMIDDNEAFAATVVPLFLSDHEVRRVGVWADARRADRDEWWDVALVDFDLQEGDGASIVETWRSRGERRPIIGTSARDKGQRALQAAGVDATCSKMGFSRIATVIQHVLTRR